MFVSNTESDTLMCAQLWGWALVSHNQTLELPSSYIWANFVFPLKITLTSKSWEEHTWLSNLVVLKFWLHKIPVSRLQSIPYQWNQNVWDPILFLKSLMTHVVPYTSLVLPTFQIPKFFSIHLSKLAFKINFPPSSYCPNCCYIIWKLAWLVKNRVGPFWLVEAPEIQRWVFYTASFQNPISLWPQPRISCNEGKNSSTEITVLFTG